MRLVIDSLIALMLVGILAGVLVYHRQQQQDLQRCQSVQRSLALMQEQILFRGALGDVPTTDSGFPAEISPAWFSKTSMPVNVLVSGRRPWVDIADANDLSDHPGDIVVTRNQQAGFWYNPRRGIVRARVAPQLSEQETLRLYNRINSSSLKSLTVASVSAPVSPPSSDHRESPGEPASGGVAPAKPALALPTRHR